MTLVQTGKSDPKPIVCLQAPGCDCGTTGTLLLPISCSSAV